MIAPPFLRRLWLWGLLVLVLGGSGLLLHRQQLRTRVAQVLPDPPATKNLSVSLQADLLSAEQQARSWQPVAGLARLARIYHANGLLEEAAECERQLIDLEPDNPLWPYLLAQLYGGFGQLEEAIPLLQRTLDLSPDYVPARIRLADCHFKLNAFTAAEAAYRAAYEAGGHNVYAALGLARIHLAAGRTDEARTQLREALVHHPGFPAAAKLLETLDAQQGAGPRDEIRSAAPSEMPDPWVESLMDDCHDPYRLSVAAAALASANTAARAQQLLERAISLDPGYAAAHRHLGLLLSARGDSRGARQHLEQAVRIGPRDADNWNHLIRLLRDTGDLQAARDALQRGLTHCPDSPALHLEMGRVHAAAGNLPEALGEFRTAQRLRPEEANSYIEIALVHFRLNQLQPGIAEVRRALGVEPNHPIGLVLVARYAISTGDEAAAREWIRRCRLQPKITPPELSTVTAEFEQAFGRRP